MCPSPDETDLLSRFRRGDRAAFDTLYTRHASGVLAFARRLTGGDQSEAEDLTQETFVAAFRGADRFRGGARLSTWLLGITLRRFRDRSRQERPSSLPLNEDTGAVSLVSPVENAVVQSVTFERAMAHLDAPLREAFLLVAGQGLTQREAADVLQIPLGTVKWRVAEAARRLRIALSDPETSAANTAAPLEEPRNVSPVQL